MEDESKKEEDDSMRGNTSAAVYGASKGAKESNLQTTGSKIKILESKSNQTLRIAWNPKNHMLAFGGDKGYSALWDMKDDLAEAEEISALPHVAPEPLSKSLADHATTIFSIDWKPDGTSFITGANDGICRMWDTSGNATAVMLNEESMPLSKKDGTPPSGEPPSKDHIYPIDIDCMYDCKWNKDGTALVTVSEKNNVILWNTEGKLRASYQGHTDGVTSIDWKNNNMFATSSIDGIIKIWDVQSSSAKKTLSSHDSPVKCLKWDPAGAFLASGSEDSTIQIFNTKHDDVVITFNEHKEMINQLAWSPTGYNSNLPNSELRLASASSDDTIKIWSLATNK